MGLQRPRQCRLRDTPTAIKGGRMTAGGQQRLGVKVEASTRKAPPGGELCAAGPGAFWAKCRATQWDERDGAGTARAALGVREPGVVGGLVDGHGKPGADVGGAASTTVVARIPHEAPDRRRVNSARIRTNGRLGRHVEVKPTTSRRRSGSRPPPPGRSAKRAGRRRGLHPDGGRQQRTPPAPDQRETGRSARRCDRDARASATLDRPRTGGQLHSHQSEEGDRGGRAGNVRRQHSRAGPGDAGA